MDDGTESNIAGLFIATMVRFLFIIAFLCKSDSMLIELIIWCVAFGGTTYKCNFGVIIKVAFLWFISCKSEENLIIGSDSSYSLCMSNNYLDCITIIWFAFLLDLSLSCCTSC